MSGSQRYVKVGPTDVAFAGKRTSVMVGPVAHRGAEHTQSAFRELARRGPSARIGLQPSPTTNKWLFDPERCGVVSTIGQLDMDEMLMAFEGLVAQTACGTEPVVVTHCGNYVMLSIDHGIGDATVCLELTAIAAGSEVEGFLVPNLRRPLGSALVRTVAANPHSIIDGFRVRGRPAPSPTRRYPPAKAQHIAMSYIRTGPGFTAAVKKLRERHFPQTSITAAVAYAIRSAFEGNGCPTTDDVSILVDLRRYLGGGKATLANMSAVADLTVPASADIAEFGARFSEAVSGAGPLIRMAGSAAKRRLRGWPQNAPEAAEWPIKSRLTLSDPSRHPSMRKIRWVESEEPMAYVIINDPVLPHAITITAICDTEQCFNLTASYFSGSYDRADISRILAELAKDPTPYLASAAISGV